MSLGMEVPININSRDSFSEKSPLLQSKEYSYYNNKPVRFESNLEQGDKRNKVETKRDSVPFEDEERWFSRDIPSTVKEFHTDLDKGLSSYEAKRRLQMCGPNIVADDRRTSWIVMLVRQFFDFMVLLLLAAGIASLILQDWIEASTLFAVVLSNVTISFIQEYRAENALQALKQFTVPRAIVLRNGVRKEIQATQVVPGDIALLEEGVSVPADLRIVEATNLQVMEAVLTGESTPVDKKPDMLEAKDVYVGDQSNMGFMSTNVLKGRGKGIVVRTGRNTEVGKISNVLTSMETKQTTLLQRRIRKLGAVLVVLSVVLCALVVGLGFFRQWRAGGISAKDVKIWIKVGVSLAVSVIPEGLLAVATVTMALGVQRMAQRNAIVRKLATVETLGQITSICADKTGTLTLGKMRTNEIWIAGHTWTMDHNNPDQGGPLFEELEKGGSLYSHQTQSPISHTEFPKHLQKAMMIFALCNNSTVEVQPTFKTPQTPRRGREAPHPPTNTTPEVTTLGDPTEVALEISAQKAKLGKRTWIDTFGFRFLREIPFDSDRARMTVIYSHAIQESADWIHFLRDVDIILPDVEGDFQHTKNHVVYHFLCKGSPGSILKICSKRLEKVTNGQYVFGLMTESAKQDIEAHATQMASKGLRVLGLAYKEQFVAPGQVQEYENNLKSQKFEAIETECSFLGLVGIIDPPRHEVRYAIDQCKKAGIKVHMITGDHPDTAMGIASTLGIVSSENPSAVMRGNQLDKMSVQQLAEMDVSEFPDVFARISPDNKLKIIKALKRRGEVVSMTGDGVNDAMAIQYADAGISMGKSATDLTKQSADIILTDDNLNSLIPAIEEGRRTYDNIQKFIMYLLSCNSAEIYVMLIAIGAGLPAPFTPVMILWANLVCDLPPALALGVDPPERDVLTRMPRDPATGIFTWKTALIVLAHGFSMAGLTLGLFIYSIYYLGYETDFDPDIPGHARGLSFIALAMMQLIHAFLARSPKHTVFSTDIWSNKWLLAGVAVSTLSLVAACYIPGLKGVLGQWPLDYWDWLYIGGCIVAHVFIVEMIKVAVRCVESHRVQRKERAGTFYSEV